MLNTQVGLAYKVDYDQVLSGLSHILLVIRPDPQKRSRFFTYKGFTCY